MWRREKKRAEREVKKREMRLWRREVSGSEVSEVRVGREGRGKWGGMMV